MSTIPVEILHAAHPGWDEARRAWNLAVDQRPAAIALPRTVAGVQAAVRYAADHGLRVAAQGTGHGAAALGPLDGTLLVRTAGMADVVVDPERRTAQVGAGALTGDVVAAAAEHGLATLAGTAMDVGVVGYTLGGGIGWLARSHGLAANHVRAIELVTADGEHLLANRDEHRELFWALRGGGGAFGVVTAIELELVPLAQAYAGMLTFPVERARELLGAWREWTAGAPDAVTSTARLMAFPPAPELPEPLRGRRLVVIDGVDGRDEAAAAAHLEPLRRLGAGLDTFATVPTGALGAIHMDPAQPVPAVAEHALLDDLAPEALDALVPAGVAGLEAGLLMVELRHLGGALAVAPAGAGALSHLEAGYLVHVVGVPMAPGAAAALDGAVDAVLAAVDPWRTEWAYLNFCERGLDGRRAFADAALRRLQAVKALHDPDGRIQANVRVAG